VNAQLPVDGVVQIAFDRLLHPASVTRQSFSMHDDSGNYLEPVVTYDPVARVVTLSSNNPNTSTWLTAGVTYEIDIGVSAANDYTGGSGPRAIDGATLTAAVTETFQAVTPATPTPSADNAIRFCDDVLPVFQYRCSGGSCHAAPVGPLLPAEGLILETSEGVENTAVNRTSQESNTGALANPPQVQGHPFGVDMGIITPGDPGASWLVYKVLLGQHRPIDNSLDAGAPTCGGGAVVEGLQLPTPQPSATQLLPSGEQEILSQYILGNQMPYPINLLPTQQTPDPSTLPMTFDEMERLRAWIAQGAVVDQCTQCPSAD
jgi:hypothetical protein